ncbi:hypothetical protein BDD12DRAFT_62789 [Trichophaea hybrida]|nr:hypothetical protein BDD12DRAFT_62789 [Trichophaea hybrida]
MLVFFILIFSLNSFSLRRFSFCVKSSCTTNCQSSNISPDRRRNKPQTSSFPKSRSRSSFGPLLSFSLSSFSLRRFSCRFSSTWRRTVRDQYSGKRCRRRQTANLFYFSPVFGRILRPLVALIRRNRSLTFGTGRSFSVATTSGVFLSVIVCRALTAIAYLIAVMTSVAFIPRISI